MGEIQKGCWEAGRHVGREGETCKEVHGHEAKERPMPQSHQEKELEVLGLRGGGRRRNEATHQSPQKEEVAIYKYIYIYIYIYILLTWNHFPFVSLESKK